MVSIGLMKSLFKFLASLLLRYKKQPTTLTALLSCWLYSAGKTFRPTDFVSLRNNHICLGTDLAVGGKKMDVICQVQASISPSRDAALKLCKVYGFQDKTLL